MRLRATPLHLLGAVSLAALFAANVASACNGAHAKSASAANMSCSHSCSMSACSHAASAAVVAPASVELPGLPSLVQQPAQPIVAGLMAFLDPETGLLGGPIGDLQVPQDLATLNSQALLAPVTMANGSVMIDLQGSGQEYMILTIDALGHRGLRCSTDPREATQTLAPAAKTSALTPSER